MHKPQIPFSEHPFLSRNVPDTRPPKLFLFFHEIHAYGIYLGKEGRKEKKKERKTDRREEEEERERDDV